MSKTKIINRLLMFISLAGLLSTGILTAGCSSSSSKDASQDRMKTIQGSTPPPDVQAKINAQNQQQPPVGPPPPGTPAPSSAH